MIGIVSASIADWGRYESRHWRTMRLGGPERDDARPFNRHQNLDFSEERGTLDWSVRVAVREAG